MVVAYGDFLRAVKVANRVVLYMRWLGRRMTW